MQVLVKVWILFLLCVWAFAGFGGLLKLMNII